MVDDVHIVVKAGSGGNGCTATKQLFGSKKTTPDGGNGGNGGSIYFKADSNVSDLATFKFKKKIRGIDGVSGLNKDLDGANGDDITVLVPFGTSIIDEDSSDHVELTTDLPFCVARGGHGGMGNHDYKPDLERFSSRVFLGANGDERKLHLILNLIADIGLVGLPNAGKSSLLKALTNALPKVGNYPFTTLEPNLGALGKIIIADIPGLIEGASEGKGLGIQFLKHVKKTKILLHCIDATNLDLIATYNTVRKEFGGYDKSLLEKKEIVLITKTDLVEKDILSMAITKLKKVNKNILPVSVYDPSSLEELKKIVATEIEHE